MERIVLDTNLYVSHLLVPSGLPGQIFAKWQALAFHLIVSPAILAEVRQTLGYARIRRKCPFTHALVERLITLLEHDSILILSPRDFLARFPT